MKDLRIVLLGAPGVGKGTQAMAIHDRTGYPHISTGDLLRENVAKGTPLGIEAKGHMDSGELVPNEVVIGMMSVRLGREDCSDGFILDGYPRTLEQAEALNKITEVDIVLNIEVSEDVIIDRLSGRRSCPGCGAVYNMNGNRPEIEGKCDRCGKGLILRDDDKPETIRTRFAIYREKTEPLIRYYEEKGLVRGVDASGSVEQTTENTRTCLGI